MYAYCYKLRRGLQEFARYLRVLFLYERKGQYRQCTITVIIAFFCKEDIRGHTHRRIDHDKKLQSTTLGTSLHSLRNPVDREYSEIEGDLAMHNAQ